MQYSAKKDKDGVLTRYTRPLKDGKARAGTYLVISLWKILVFFICFVTIPLEHDSEPRRLFTDFITSFETNQYILSAPGSATSVLVVEELLREELFWKSQTLVLIVQVHYLNLSESIVKKIFQIGSSLLTYSFSAFACRSNIQHTGFAVPISLITPLSASVLGALCFSRQDNPCAYSSTFPKYLFFECPADISSTSYWASSVDSIWGLPIVFIICFLFHLITTSQIWEESNKKLLAITEIFATDYYNGLLIVPSLTLNKKRPVDEDEPIITKPDHRKDNGLSNPGYLGDDFPRSEKFHPTEEDKKVRINACATMWHENSEEIQVCLKSVFKMDKYINDRRQHDHERSEWQRWEWTTHIFFDDCMKKSKLEKVMEGFKYFKSKIPCRAKLDSGRKT